MPRGYRTKIYVQEKMLWCKIFRLKKLDNTRYMIYLQLYNDLPYDAESECDDIISYQHLVLVLVAAKDVSFDESGKNVACANELLLLQL